MNIGVGVLLYIWRLDRGWALTFAMHMFV